MSSLRTSAVGLLVAFSIAAVVVAKNKPKEIGSINAHQRAVHALDRLTFGPRPGDVERVAAMGLEKWIDLQLHPEKIDDSPMQARLVQYRTLSMSTREIVIDFPPNPVLKAAKEGKVAIPQDPYRRAIYMAGIARLDNKSEAKQNASAVPVSAPGSPAKLTSASETQMSVSDSPAMQSKRDRHEVRDQIDSLTLLPPDVRMQRILNLSPAEQATLLKGVPAPKRQALLVGLTSTQRETVIALDNPQGLVNYEAQSGKLLRAVYSDRQLEEVLTDFWFNHFNVYIGKGADRYLVTAYERDVIRPHVLGKFRDLLVATAQSPAMLFYLDNWQSEGPNSPAATGHPQLVAQKRPRTSNTTPGQAKRRNGLNENYARELMELHTVGVNGGYTQQDVTEVARVFTGWTLQEPREGGGFVFKEKLHDPGNKTVLGHKIKENGEKEGLQVLDILAHSPATAHFISLKLAQRFVADDPPPALVDEMAKTFHKTDGDLREVMRTMLRSQQFWAPEAYRAKVKTPFEFVVSALRATDTAVTETMPLLNTLNKMGMQIYGMQPPTGYSTNADTWVNSAALLDRMNFALALVNNRIGGARFDGVKLLPDTASSESAAGQPDPDAALLRLEQGLLAGDISPQTHETIEREIGQTTGRGQSVGSLPSTNTTVALLLGSPEFQRR